MNSLPLFHRVEGKRGLIVGGGLVALRRAKILVSAGMKLDVVAPELGVDLAALIHKSGGEVFARKFSTDVVSTDYYLIIAATDVREVNKAVEQFARVNNIIVNIADSHLDCDVIFPSLVTRDSITIAISNNGLSPVLSRLLKEQIDGYLPDTYGELSDLVGQYRDRVKQAIPDVKARVKFWETVLQGAIAESVFTGNKHLANEALLTALEQADIFVKTGEVYLIDTGPGDPDLLTVRALRMLQKAEVVLYDSLVEEEIRDLLKPQTESFCVDHCDDYTVSPDKTGQILVKYARQGKRIAYLKKGNSFITGCDGQEIAALTEAGVSFQIVPGIKS